MRLWLILAGLNGMMAVGLDAYARHGLDADSYGAEMFDFATRYQIYHALVLIGVAWLADRGAGWLASAAGWCLVGGIVLFSGTLYILGQTGVVLVEGAAPLGGGLLMLGWVLLGAAGLRVRPNPA